MARFKIRSNLKPAGDQKEAIKKLVESIKNQNKYQTLLGVTGSGKTFTMAKVIEELQMPSLVISHNKTLSAQLYREFKTFFPDNAVEYFVSYYDYYQPESYIPQKDLYIEKDASINAEIERLRLRATTALMERQDVIIVATVSSIYGLGSPELFREQIITFEKEKEIDFDEILNKLIFMQYQRNDLEFEPGVFRLKGENLDIFPAYEEEAVRISFFDRIIEKISKFNPVTGELKETLEKFTLFPAKHFITPIERLKKGIEDIKKEMEEQEKMFLSQGRVVEAQRIRTRTLYDIELILETGTCPGIENYSRPLTGRPPGSAAETLISYFPENFITFIDESHVTVPQLKGMYRGDRARKENLINFGFRLPSAYDNRPLYYEEFEAKTKYIVFVSATPSEFELSVSKVIAEQLIRPTGLVDPEMIVRPSSSQVQDLLEEVKKTVNKNERILVTTLTKKMAEELTDYFIQKGIKARFLHSEIETLDRVELIRDLRKGVFDCLIGVNLLREGLDLPEVSLVAVLDADKEGFLRSTTSLIQTAGRAARNINGRVILYADEITDSIKKAVEETERRRKKQQEYNRLHNITPKSIKKEVVDIIEREHEESLSEVEKVIKDVHLTITKRMKLSDSELKEAIIKELEHKMFEYADKLEFEKAALLRDHIAAIKNEKIE